MKEIQVYFHLIHTVAQQKLTQHLAINIQLNFLIKANRKKLKNKDSMFPKLKY